MGLVIVERLIMNLGRDSIFVIQWDSFTAIEVLGNEFSDLTALLK
jgi:hypothetical protein